MKAVIKLHKLEPASLRRAEESTHKLLFCVNGLKYHLISEAVCCRTALEKIFYVESFRKGLERLQKDFEKEGARQTE